MKNRERRHGTSRALEHEISPMGNPINGVAGELVHKIR